MAVENEPRLVKKDGSTMTPADAPMSRADFLAAVQMIVSAQGASSDVQSQKTDAVVDALQHIRADINKGEYNIANFPNKSAFNPRGENKTVGGVPRPMLKGEVSWVGTPVVWHEQTYDEMVLLNEIEAGIYHNGEWTVTDMTPGVKGSRKLYVHFPNKTTDERANLPSDYWDYNARDENGEVFVGMDDNEPTKRGRRVSGMEIMLREMVETAKARVAVTV